MVIMCKLLKPIGSGPGSGSKYPDQQKGPLTVWSPRRASLRDTRWSLAWDAPPVHTPSPGCRPPAGSLACAGTWKVIVQMTWFGHARKLEFYECVKFSKNMITCYLITLCYQMGTCYQIKCYQITYFFSRRHLFYLITCYLITFYQITSCYQITIDNMLSDNMLWDNMLSDNICNCTRLTK
jgi:hypothetical protein